MLLGTKRENPDLMLTIFKNGSEFLPLSLLMSRNSFTTVRASEGVTKSLLKCHNHSCKFNDKSGETNKSPAGNSTLSSVRHASMLLNRSGVYVLISAPKHSVAPAESPLRIIFEPGT